MPDHEASATVAADPDAVFGYLADVHHLPEYFPMMTSAEPVPGEDAVRTTAVLQPEESDAPAGSGEQVVHGEAWFRADEDDRSLEWGSEGPSDYRGELRVDPDGDGSRISLRIHTPEAHDGVDESLQRSLDSIVAAVGPTGEGG